MSSSADGKAILVVGAGRVGPVLAAMLSAVGGYRVTLADVTDEALSAGERAGFSMLYLDATRLEETRRALAGFDAVVCAAPQGVCVPLARAALETGTDYFDLAEDTAGVEAVAAGVPDSTALLVPGCGFAPGLVHDAAAALVRQMPSPSSVIIRVGAIPALPTNRLRYGLSWNVEALIDEYTQPCHALVGGEITTLAPLTAEERVIVGGLELEAFTTAGGAETLCRRLQGKVRELTFKTLRYPGHLDLIRFLVEDLGLKERRHLLATLFRNGLPEIHQDLLIALVTVRGEVGGVLTERSELRRIEAMPGPAGSYVSALSRASAAHLAAVLDLVQSARPQPGGLLHHEDLPFAALSASRFLRGLEQPVAAMAAVA
ncbi:saccharopine dehydrogenase family protein [Radicibacter daui]|uniref:saccharopine dehydrogenase family protein n=1 Tax=Radicibacter daui TaxID=3064829 RepID=UPI004046B4E9